jgi:four helix bundle protein
MKIKRFEELECWKEARILTKIVYELVKNDGFLKDYRLRDQITGAAVSIMNNIAEGFGSQSNAEFVRFLTYARRSTLEVQSCLYVALDQRYVTEDEFNGTYVQADTVIRITDGLLRYLRPKRAKPAQRTKLTQQA